MYLLQNNSKVMCIKSTHMYMYVNVALTFINIILFFLTKCMF